MTYTQQKMKKGIPDRWENYLPMGCPVPGTRFLPFKVPLKPELCREHPEDEWFTPSMLLENKPMLKAVIDLTNTDRYYNSEDFTKKGVLYKKINIFGGGKLPPRQIREQFFNAVDQLDRMLDDSDALIGVHCTHGLNRTGYLICKYMVLRMKIDPQEAINKFQEARGYKIERKNFVSDIVSESSDWQQEQQSLSGSSWPRSRTWRPNSLRHVPETTNCRSEPRLSPRSYSRSAPYYRNREYIAHENHSNSAPHYRNREQQFIREERFSDYKRGRGRRTRK